MSGQLLTLQPSVALGIPSSEYQAGELDMDAEERLRDLELAMQNMRDSLRSHETVCLLRFDAFVSQQKEAFAHERERLERLAQMVKYLAIAVVALTALQLGIVTVRDVIKAGAGQIGITMESRP
jgi:hypothetical protein